MKTMQLKCKNCNATMEVHEDEQEVVCPYCGNREKLLDSDAVAMEKIKSNTYKEMEMAKMENENRKQAEATEKEDQKNYRKSKLSIVTLVFTFISLFMMISAFGSHRILAGIIALLQTGVFAVSWLMGMRIIQDKKRFLHVALAVLGFMLLIPYMMCNSGEQLEKLQWPSRGLAEQLPDPEAKYGDVLANNENNLSVEVERCSDKDYESYLEACMAMGYTVESEEADSSYTAYNSEGYQLSLMHYTDSLHINLEAPVSMEEYQWPDSKIAKKLPQTKSQMGKIDCDSEDRFAVYVGNTSPEDYEAYVKQVKAAGFKKDYAKTDNTFYADDKNGYHVSVEYKGNQTIYVAIDAPDEEEMSSSEEKDSKQDIDSDSNKDDTQEEKAVKKEKKKKSEKKSSKKVDPKLKAFLDEYETFVDKYVKFMKKYDSDSSDLNMYSDYMDLLRQEMEFQEKLSEYDEDSMSAADAAYYAKVTARCAKKLAEAAQ